MMQEREGIIAGMTSLSRLKGWVLEDGYMGLEDGRLPDVLEAHESSILIASIFLLK